LCTICRHGPGREEFGNLIGLPSCCPLGYKHHGNGYCVYTGQYRAGEFHGEGELVCVLGPKYKGEWRDGQRHGKVSTHALGYVVSHSQRNGPKCPVP
jgi:hypothetical protein